MVIITPQSYFTFPKFQLEQRAILSDNLAGEGSIGSLVSTRSQWGLRLPVLSSRSDAIWQSYLECPNFSKNYQVELVEGYYQQLEALLLEIGYLLLHTAAPRMEKLRRRYNRSQLSPNELA